MGAASTVPVEGVKSSTIDTDAQPKNVFSGSVNKIQDAEKVCPVFVFLILRFSFDIIIGVLFF